MTWNRFSTGLVGERHKKILAYDELTGRCEVVTWIRDNWYPRKGSPFSFTHWQEFHKPQPWQLLRKPVGRPLTELSNVNFIAYDYNETILYRTIGTITFANVNFEEKTYTPIVSVVSNRFVLEMKGIKLEKGAPVEYRLSNDEAFDLSKPGEVVLADLKGFNSEHAVLFFPANREKLECGMYAYVDYDAETNQFVRNCDGRETYLHVPQSNPTSEQMLSALLSRANTCYLGQADR